MTELTPLDLAHAAMMAAPDDDAARLRFYERIADVELFVLLEAEPDGDQINPVLLEDSYVIVFDRSARLAAYVGDAAPYVALSGRAIAGMLDGQPLGTHIYICGPKGMIGWVRGKAADLGWPREAVHYEEFLAPQSGKPFDVKLAVSNKVIHVGEHQSLLEAIEAAGVDAPYLCRGGACGQCETDVIGYDGKFVHRDHWLEADQKASGKKIMPCVSRFEGKTLVLDR